MTNTYYKLYSCMIIKTQIFLGSFDLDIKCQAATLMGPFPLSTKRKTENSYSIFYFPFQHEGPPELPPMDNDPLLRVDFVREVDELLKEIRSEDIDSSSVQGLDPESVAARLKQEERQRTVKQVEALLELAVTLTW